MGECRPLFYRIQMDDRVMPDYSKIIHRILADRDISLRTMAKESGIHRLALQKIKDKRTLNPGAQILIKLYRVYGVNPAVLLGDETDEFYLIR